jgi:hypothetical protein
MWLLGMKEKVLRCHSIESIIHLIPSRLLEPGFWARIWLENLLEKSGFSINHRVVLNPSLNMVEMIQLPTSTCNNSSNKTMGSHLQEGQAKSINSSSNRLNTSNTVASQP